MRLAYLFTIIAVVVWTTGPVGAKAALLATGDGGRLTPMEVALWPVALGWVGLTMVMVGQRRLGMVRAISARGWVVLIAMGLSGWVGFQVLLNVAYTRLDLAEALIISYLNPIFVVLLQGRAFGAFVRPISLWEELPDVERRPSPKRLAIGLALGLLGVGVIATGGRLSALSVPGSMVGAAAALAGAIAWGVYSNLGRFVAVRGQSARGLTDVQNVVAMAVGIAVMVGVLAGEGRLRWPGGFMVAVYLGSADPASLSVWVPIVVMGVLNYAIGYTFWLRALEEGHRLGQAHRLPPLTYLTLVFAIVAGWLVLRQPIGSGFWQGAVLIAAGNVMTLWPERTARPRENDSG